MKKSLMIFLITLGAVLQTALAVAVLIPVISFFMYEPPANPVLMSLGDYETKDYYTSGGFQDYTDYAKYTYKNPNVENNRYLEKINKTSLDDFKIHIENFESWVDCVAEYDEKNELVVNYDFDMSVVSDDDYLYIEDDPDYPELGSYDVYFFDTQTETLYFFHSNI